MLRMFRTEQDKVKETDRIQSGVWIELINPEQEEAEKIAKALNIEIEDIVASTDPDEKNRIEFINNYTLILVDMPVQEMRHGTVNYTTIPLGIILTKENVITVSTVESPILAYFHQDH
ncbi:MAG: magnesium transporter CorA family protein, partial [Clostridia bacterium]|nr:magnesium transporter CorA family protein [Clostridia bacterium]